MNYLLKIYSTHQLHIDLLPIRILDSESVPSINGSLFVYRRAADLEPLQQLLKKFIRFLETEVVPSTSENLRPRSELDRSAAWIGIKSL